MDCKPKRRRIMISKLTRILTAIVGFLPLIIGVLLYSRLPESVATHWDFSGNINGTSSRVVAAIVIPGIFFLLTLAMPALLKIDPKYKNMSHELVNIIIWAIPLISFVLCSICYANALGYNVDVATVVPILIGIMFIIIGNYLPKTHQSYTMGIRLPWTLNSEENWNRTHRLAGWLWMIGGLLIALSPLLPLTWLWFAIAIAIMTLVPAVYSYILYSKGI